MSAGAAGIVAVRELVAELQSSLGYSSICLFADQSKPHIVAMYKVGAYGKVPAKDLGDRAVSQACSVMDLDAEQALDSLSPHWPKKCIACTTGCILPGCY